MAKTIKFNLICDNKPIRTIEDLQNNFSVEDVLAYYDNRLLHKWLKVRDYEEELEKVNAITAEKPIEIIKELIKIFNIIGDEKKIEESVYILEYLNERKFLFSVYEKENLKLKSIIDDYVTGYWQLVDRIKQNPHDVSLIKATISEMVANYSWILMLNHRDLFWTLKNISPLAIMCLLMNEGTRTYYLPIETKDENGTATSDIKTYDNKSMFQQICSIINASDFEENFGETLLSFSGITDGYWKDLEPQGKKYMIIKMESGDFVRSAGLSGGDLSCTDIEHKFVIIDGIDYKSNYSNHTLLYMEV